MDRPKIWTVIEKFVLGFNYLQPILGARKLCKK